MFQGNTFSVRNSKNSVDWVLTCNSDMLRRRQMDLAGAGGHHGGDESEQKNLDNGGQEPHWRVDH